MEKREWTTDETRYLIQLYKRQRLLYDMSDRFYTATKKREKAINKITKEMSTFRPNTTSNEIKEKIRLLRAQFIGESHAEQQAIEGGIQNYEPKLWCFNLLQFLKPPKNVADCDENIEYEEEEANEGDALIYEIQPEIPQNVPQRKPRRQARREDNEKYRDKHHNNLDSIEMIDMNGYQSNFKGKKGTERLRRKQERALIAIQLAKQFACKYSQKQKASKNLMFSNFICDELDNITHDDLLQEVKWEIQELVRNAIKRDMAATQEEQNRQTCASVEIDSQDGGGSELLFNVEI